MAVFVASAFFSFAAYAQLAAGNRSGALRHGEVMATLSSSSSAGTAAARLAGVPGVTDVLPLPAVDLGDMSLAGRLQSDGPWLAWVVPCERLLAAVDVPGASCGGASIYTMLAGGIPDGSYPVVRFDDEGNPVAEPSGVPPVQLLVDATTARPLVPGSADGQTGMAGLPQAIVEPSALGAAAADISFTQLYIATDGTAAASERVRAALQGLDPLASVALAGDPLSQIPQFAEVARIVGIGLIGSLALAGCSLAVATTTGLLQRRRQFVLLRASGMPMSRLRTLILLQAGVPLIAVSALSALLGIAVAQGVLLTSGVPNVPLPDASLAVVLGASMVVAMAVVVATLPAVDRLTRPQSLRSE